MRTQLRVGLLALAVSASVFATGCSVLNRIGGSGSRHYHITTNREIYSRGNTGEATIRNVSGQTLEYNLCQRRLERQVNKYWVVAFEWPTAGGACTTEARRLPDDESVSTLFDIPTGVPIGRYRVVFTNLHGPDGKSLAGEDAATPSFDVR